MPAIARLVPTAVGERITNPEPAEFLQLPEGHPVIVVVRLTHDQHGRAMDVAINVLRDYQWRLIYEWGDTKKEG